MLAGSVVMAQDALSEDDLFYTINCVPMNDDEQANIEGGLGPVALVAVAAGSGAAAGVGGYLVACEVNGTEPTVGGAVASGVVGAATTVFTSAATVGSAAIGMGSAYIKAVAVNASFSVAGGVIVAASDQVSRRSRSQEIVSRRTRSRRH